MICFLRKGNKPDELLLVVCNFTPMPRYNYRVGIPRGGFWTELLNSDARDYGGSGHGNFGGLRSAPIPSHGRLHSINVTAPPLGVVFFKLQGEPGA